MVPVGIKSSVTFEIHNKGYENLELRSRLPPDCTHLPISVSFPQGQIIGIGRETVPVQVSFVAPRPMSFSARIEFLDMDGNRFTIPVTGTTDNSILTVQDFVSSTPCEIRLNRDGKVPMLFDHVDAKAAASAFNLPDADSDDEAFAGFSNFSSVASSAGQAHGQGLLASAANAAANALSAGDTEWDPDEKPLLRSAVLIMRFFEATNLLRLKSNPATFPADFVQSSGLTVFDMVGRSV